MYQCATNIYSRRIINVFVQYAPLKWLPVNSNNKQWGGFSDFNNVVLEIFWDIRDEFQYVNNQGVERSILNLLLFVYVYLFAIHYYI